MFRILSSAFSTIAIFRLQQSLKHVPNFKYTDLDALVFSSNEMLYACRLTGHCTIRFFCDKCLLIRPLNYVNRMFARHASKIWLRKRPFYYLVVKNSEKRENTKEEKSTRWWRDGTMQLEQNERIINHIHAKMFGLHTVNRGGFKPNYSRPMAWCRWCLIASHHPTEKKSSSSLSSADAVSSIEKSTHAQKPRNFSLDVNWENIFITILPQFIS